MGFFTAPGPQGNDSNGGFNFMFFMVAWLVAAVLLFLLRPQSTRPGDEKPSSNQVKNYLAHQELEILLC